jgi:predicted ester cyclase
VAGTAELSPREVNERVLAALNEGDVDRALGFVSDDAIDHSVPATGRSFEVMVLDMMRVHDAKVAEHWALFDQADFESQLRRQ